MKIIISLLFLFGAYSVSAQEFNYNEIGDTIFINGKKIIPGDTLFLGKGSDPLGGFIYIIQKPPKNVLNAALSKTKYLTKEFSNTFLIYAGRFDEGYGVQKYYLPAFYAFNNKQKLYNISFPQAIKTLEIKGFN